MPATYGYLRVSTDGQAQSGLGIEAQQQTIRQVYDLTLKPHGFEEPVILKDEGVSRSKFLSERPGGAELCRRVNRGDVIVFAKIDRGFGSLRDLLNQLAAWDASGVRIIAADIGGMFYDSKNLGLKIIVTIMGLAAEFEHGRACQRQKDRWAAGRAMGRPGNQKAPFGLRIVRIFGRPSYQPDDNERAVMAKMLGFFEKGYSTLKIAQHMNKSRVPTRRVNLKNGQSRAGGPWCKDRVRRMIQMEAKYREMEKGLPPGHFVTPEGVVLKRARKIEIDAGGRHDYVFDTETQPPPAADEAAPGVSENPGP